MLRDRIRDVIYDELKSVKSAPLADKILAEIPEITEDFCIQNQLKWERSDRTVSGFQYLCNAINAKIRGEIER